MFTAWKRLALFPVMILIALGLAGCTNPFDPIDKSSAIRGLSYIDFSITWDRWDSDPESDGVSVSVEYFNEFGDSLEFHDKPHRVVIEFYSQKIVGGEVSDTGEVTGGRPTHDKLFFSFPVEHSFSDDDIRVPIEAYSGALQAAGYSLEEPALAFVVVNVFPPKAVPQSQLVSFYGDMEVFVPEPTAATEEEVQAN